VRYAWVKDNRETFAVERMCRVLQVSRSGFNQWRVRKPSRRQVENESLDAKVATIHEVSERTYGRPRIVQSLKDQGHQASPERVRKSLQRQGLRPIHKRPYRVTTDSEHSKPIAPNVLARRFDGWAINQAWVADITYIATDEGWLYLAAILDLASRKIVGWSMNARMTKELVCDALKSAYWARKPATGLIMHTDRGSQYASDEYRKLLGQYKMIQSMSRRANCWDNSVMESFFKTLKVERAHRIRYATRAQAKLDLVNWIEGRYNRSRLHSSNGYQSPVQKELGLRVA
jgi:putative transposase